MKAAVRTATAVVTACSLALVGCSGEGCSDAPSGAEPSPPLRAADPDPDPDPAHGSAKGDGGEGPAARPPGTVARARDARIGGEAAGEGDPVHPGAALVLGEQGELVVDLRPGGRLELGPGARAELGDEAEALLFLVAGRARATLPPAGNSARPALRVATPRATVQIGRSGDAWTVVTPGGRSVVAVLQGRAEVMTGAADSEGQLQRWRLGAGEGRAVEMDGPAEPFEGPQRVQQAAARTRQWMRAKPGPPPARLRQALRRAAAALDDALDGLERERRRGEELREARKGAATKGDGGRRTLRRQLADHSRAMLRLRQLVLVRWERVKAGAMQLGDGDDPDGGPAAQRRERVRTLLGLSAS